jgi:hypothetical protein
MGELFFELSNSVVLTSLSHCEVGTFILGFTVAMCVVPANWEEVVYPIAVKREGRFHMMSEVIFHSTIFFIGYISVDLD